MQIVSSKNLVAAALLPIVFLVSVLVPMAGAHQQEPLRIACVGDSITEGTANAEHAINSWPRILDRLLEQASPGRFETGNFGRSGATLLRQGHRPYWDEDVFPKGCAFLPQIVIINLGTNDAVNRNWLRYGDEFEGDFRDLIKVYSELPSEPRIWLSNLTPMTDRHPSTLECAPQREIIEETILRLAAEFGLEVIDFKTPLTGQPNLFPDGLHPNTAGNELMALAAFEVIAGRASAPDASIRPRAVEGTPKELVKAGRAQAVELTAWRQSDEWIEGTGARKLMLSSFTLDGEDFHLRARLRMLGQRNSAAGFMLDSNFFGFEGARGTLFRNGPQMGGGLRLLHAAESLWERDAWIDFEVIRNRGMVWFLVNDLVVEMAHIPGPIERIGFDPTRSTMQVSDWSLVGGLVEKRAEQLSRRTKATPWVDLAQRTELQSAGDLPAPKKTPALLRANERGALLQVLARRSLEGNSLVRLSSDDGQSWSDPWQLPVSLSGAGHCAQELPGGQMLITFRDQHETSPTCGDFVAWLGTYDDLLNQSEGRLTCRLLEDASPLDESVLQRLELMEDGSLAFTAGRRSKPGADLQALRVRFTLEQMTELLPTEGYTIPLVDLDADEGRHVVVDREEGQYLGHVTSVLLEDGRTILAVYPKGHGRGPIVYKRSNDGGLTWSDRLPTPASWATSREVPTIHRLKDPQSGSERLVLWSGLYPARRALSEDDGQTWSELEPVGEWGGIVVMGFVERLRNGSYLAMFHDDGRFIGSSNQRENPPTFTLYQTFSHDGGLNWTQPQTVWSGSDVQLCEPGCVRSPDGSTLAVLLRENSRTRNSYIIFSEDEAQTWTEPRELPASLTGDRHTPVYAPDGRLFISFRDTTRESPTVGDWVGWVGVWDDLLYGREGQYRIRFKDNKHRWDTTYPGVVVLPDGTLVVTTYGHWNEGEEPFILSARFNLAELDQRAADPSNR